MLMWGISENLYHILKPFQKNQGISKSYKQFKKKENVKTERKGKPFRRQRKRNKFKLFDVE